MTPEDAKKLGVLLKEMNELTEEVDTLQERWRKEHQRVFEIQLQIHDVMNRRSHLVNEAWRIWMKQEKG